MPGQLLTKNNKPPAQLRHMVKHCSGEQWVLYSPSRKSTSMLDSPHSSDTYCMSQHWNLKENFFKLIVCLKLVLRCRSVVLDE